MTDNEILARAEMLIKVANAATKARDDVIG